MRIQFIYYLAFATILLCSIATAQWVQTCLDSCTVQCLAVSGSNLVAGTGEMLAVRYGVFLTGNNGESWTAADQRFTPLAFGVMGTNLFAGTYGGVYLSTNNGTSWTAVNNGLPSFPWVSSLAVSGTNLFAAVTNYYWSAASGCVFLSSNNGTSWTNAGADLVEIYGARAHSLAVSGTNLFAGTSFLDGRGRGVFASTDNGNEWFWAGTPFSDFSGMIRCEPYLFAGAGSAVYLSADDGWSWTQVNNGLPGTSVTALAVSPASGGTGGMNLFAATPVGVYLSTNRGTSWTEVSAGLPSASVTALAVSGTNLFAGTSGRGVWRRPLSQMITSVGPAACELPSKFLLEQNYPNPFNPTTVISYQLPVVSDVKLVVYDILGREVAVLVNEKKTPGTYEMKFDAGGLATGVYFYRLTAGEFVQVRKLLFLR